MAVQDHRLIRIAGVVAAVAIAALIALRWLPAAGQEGLRLSGGQPVELLETVWEPDLGFFRLRLVAPALAEGLDYPDVAGDMATFCRDLALPALAAEGVAAERIVVSLSSRALPLGDADPETVQFFDMFRPVGDDCIWEDF